MVHSFASISGRVEPTSIRLGKGGCLVRILLLCGIRPSGSAQPPPPPPPPPPPQIQGQAAVAVALTERDTKTNRDWRYIVGSFAVQVPVTTAKVMLPIEENTYSIMKWRFDQMSPTNRWYPVLLRYLDYIAQRIDGLGATGDEPHAPWLMKMPTVRSISC